MDGWTDIRTDRETDIFGWLTKLPEKSGEISLSLFHNHYH